MDMVSVVTKKMLCSNNPSSFLLGDFMKPYLMDGSKCSVSDGIPLSPSASHQCNILRYFWYRASNDSIIAQHTLTLLKFGDFSGKIHCSNVFNFIYPESKGTKITYVASEAPLLHHDLSHDTMAKIFWSAVLTNNARISVQVADEQGLEKQCVIRRAVVSNDSSVIQYIIPKKEISPNIIPSSQHIIPISLPTPRYNVNYKDNPLINIDGYNIEFDSILLENEVFRKELWIITPPSHTNEMPYKFFRFVSTSRILWDLNSWDKPNTKIWIIELLKAVMDTHLQIGLQHTIFVNCAHGKDRTGGFIAIYERIQQLYHNLQIPSPWSSILDILSKEVEYFAGQQIIHGHIQQPKSSITNEEDFMIQKIHDHLTNISKSF